MPRYCCELHAKRHGHVFAALPDDHRVIFGACVKNEGAPTLSESLRAPDLAAMSKAALEDEVMTLRAQVQVLQNWKRAAERSVLAKFGGAA